MLSFRKKDIEWLQTNVAPIEYLQEDLQVALTSDDKAAVLDALDNIEAYAGCDKEGNFTEWGYAAEAIYDYIYANS